jgi:hypothetical protein
MGEFLKMAEQPQTQKEFIYMPPDASKQVADELAHQLGSDTAVIEAGLTDMRRLSVLYPKAVIPLIYCELRGRETRAFKVLYTQFLNLSVGVKGRGRAEIIRMELASRGGGNIDVNEHVEKPGWFSRNITDRDWEKRERERLGL